MNGSVYKASMQCISKSIHVRIMQKVDGTSFRQICCWYTSRTLRRHLITFQRFCRIYWCADTQPQTRQWRMNAVNYEQVGRKNSTSFLPLPSCCSFCWSSWGRSPMSTKRLGMAQMDWTTVFLFGEPKPSSLFHESIPSQYSCSLNTFCLSIFHHQVGYCV